MKTVGFDTNVLLTLKLKREHGYTKAKALLADCLDEKIRIYLSLPVILEAEWVLRSFYKQSKEKIIEFLEELILINQVILDNKDEVKLSLNLYRHSTEVSFTDCLIATQNKNQKVDEFLTFDSQLSKLYQTLP